MTQNLAVPLGAQRNEDYGPETWRLTDKTTGAAIDLTGWTFEFRISAATGLTLLLSLTASESIYGSYIRLSEAANGAFDLYIAQEDLAALPGRVIDIDRFAYNLFMTDSLGYSHAYVVGQFTVRPGV